VKFQPDKRSQPRASIDSGECQTIKDDGDDGRASYSRYGTRILECLQSSAITADATRRTWPLRRGESFKIYESPSTVRVLVSRGGRARVRQRKEKHSRWHCYDFVEV